MRKILKIAKLELSILFYSPVAWLVLTIFMIQCGVSFLDGLQGLRTSLSLGYPPGPLTKSLFGGDRGLFAVIQSTLYLYLPILTMGLMSREISSGSIKLLLSSPVKLRQIILGKYLAIILYGLLLILILAFYGIIGISSIENADLGMLFSGLFGLYLLICTYAAIGLFMSSLTSYQVVAAISTLSVFAVLRYIGNVGQDIDVIRDLTYFLSISGRSAKAVAGMINTRDIAYYSIIIISFLLLSMLRLKNERKLIPAGIKIARYAGVLFFALLLGYISSRPKFIAYLDTTASKSLTLTRTSQLLSAQFDAPVKVTTYTNMLAPNLWNTLPKYRNGDLARYEPYLRFIPQLSVDYLYYYQKPSDYEFADYKNNTSLQGITDLDSIANITAISADIDKKMFLGPAAINKIIDLRPEGFLTTTQINYKGKNTFLRFYVGENEPAPSEAEVMAALKRLLIKAPKVLFLTGNKERATDSKADREYQLVSALKNRRTSLINQGFEVDTLDLNTKQIPSDADIIVIADPRTPFSAGELEKLVRFVERGGNMLINGEPGRQNLLNPLLKLIGIQLKPGQLLKPDKNYAPGFIYTQFSEKAKGLGSIIDALRKGDGTVGMQGAAAIEYGTSGKFKVDPLLLSAGGWNRNGPVDPNELEYSFDLNAGDQKGAFPVAVSLTRNVNNKQQRIIVSGDADFICNDELTRFKKRGYNEYFMFGMFNWLSNGKFPIDVTRPPARDMNLRISRGTITLMIWLCEGFVPALIAILGAITLFRRRSS